METLHIIAVFQPLAIKQQRQKRTQKKEDEEDTVTMSYGQFKWDSGASKPDCFFQIGCVERFRREWIRQCVGVVRQLYVSRNMSDIAYLMVSSRCVNHQCKAKNPQQRPISPYCLMQPLDVKAHEAKDILKYDLCLSGATITYTTPSWKYMKTNLMHLEGFFGLLNITVPPKPRYLPNCDFCVPQLTRKSQNIKTI